MSSAPFVKFSYLWKLLNPADTEKKYGQVGYTPVHDVVDGPLADVFLLGRSVRKMPPGPVLCPLDVCSCVEA